jgi:hypothetical protein
MGAIVVVNTGIFLVHPCPIRPNHFQHVGSGASKEFLGKPNVHLIRRFWYDRAGRGLGSFIVRVGADHKRPKPQGAASQQQHQDQVPTSLHRLQIST